MNTYRVTTSGLSTLDIEADYFHTSSANENNRVDAYFYKKAVPEGGVFNISDELVGYACNPCAVSRVTRIDGIPKSMLDAKNPYTPSPPQVVDYTNTVVSACKPESRLHYGYGPLATPGV
jgi:hypothetical protein